MRFVRFTDELFADSGDDFSHRLFDKFMFEGVREDMIADNGVTLLSMNDKRKESNGNEYKKRANNMERTRYRGRKNQNGVIISSA